MHIHNSHLQLSTAPVDGSLYWLTMVTFRFLKHRYITSSSHVAQFLFYSVIESMKLNLRKLERSWAYVQVKELVVGCWKHHIETTWWKRRKKNWTQHTVAIAQCTVFKSTLYLKAWNFMCADLLIQRFEKETTLLFASAQHEFHE